MTVQPDYTHQHLIALHDILHKMQDDLRNMLVRIAAAEDKASEPLVDQVEAVIKGVIGGKVPAHKVDELGGAVAKSRSDRAVGKAIGR